ncbi:MAG: class I SAM-dependent methyltransferase [Chloroflexi bacterium]|nr:class I SAM-dependent methyltransferase [Chloroflexota bacterium]
MTGIHSFFYERIPAGAHVLDVGCGHGAVAYAIATHAKAHVVGVDLNEQSIAFARAHFKHPGLRFEVGDVTKDLAVEGADVVVLSSVLEHLSARIELLRTLVRRFGPSLFLIRVPTFERHYYAALKRDLGLFPYTDPTHLLEYSPESFADEMDQAGLEIRHLEVRWGDIWAECAPRLPSAGSVS